MDRREPIKKGKVYIGTSNVVVPGNKNSFPPEFREKSRLHYYAQLFNSIEINSCFYKIPQQSTYHRWSEDVPPDFTFTLKLCKDITHVKDLDADMQHMEKFMHAATGIGNKKGCLLIQFPGKITLEHFSKVEDILIALDRIDADNEWKRAIEFRHPSWYTGETFELLDEFNSVVILQDMKKAKWQEPRDQDAFMYMRFHGPAGDYRGSYTDEFLQEKAKLFCSWTNTGKNVYAYFNNTIGSAFDNARFLRSIIYAD
jgi:uncharacterized protein YecE (DUF72 family)